MKLLSYSSTRPGIQAIGSWAVRFGTKSQFSHTEIMFEPGDGVEHLIPDGSLEPDAEGAYWCASATVTDVMPPWSRRRSGKKGGVRWKRIVPDATRWLVQELPAPMFDAAYAAQWFSTHEGLGYDWRNIMSFINVFLNQAFSYSTEHYTCTKSTAAALGFEEPDRFHPGNLPPVIARMTGTRLQG